MQSAHRARHLRPALSSLPCMSSSCPGPSRPVHSYARPTSLTPRVDPISPGVRFVPLRPPPPSTPPPLPTRPPLAAPDGWIRTEHALPAAYPRTFVESTGSLVRESAPFALSSSSSTGSTGVLGGQGTIRAEQEESKEDKKRRIMQEVKGAILQRLNATETYEGDGQPGLWIAVERWARSLGKTGSSSGQMEGEGVTLVLTHANGFTKEVRRFWSS